MSITKIRERIAQEGQARIDAYFASEAFKRAKETEDRARRAKERRVMTAIKHRYDSGRTATFVSRCFDAAMAKED